MIMTFFWYIVHKFAFIFGLSSSFYIGTTLHIQKNEHLPTVHYSKKKVKKLTRKAKKTKKLMLRRPRMCNFGYVVQFFPLQHGVKITSVGICFYQQSTNWWTISAERNMSNENKKVHIDEYETGFLVDSTSG